MTGSMEPSQPEANVKGGGDPTPLDRACSRLKSAGLRVTGPRRAILTALIERAGPLSIGELHDDIGRSRCDLVTLYRCLAAFAEIGLVRRTFFPDRTGRYEMELGQPENYRVVCPRTRRISPLDGAAGAELARAVRAAEEGLKARGYTDVSHRVEFFGTAPAGDAGSPERNA
jgi:Fur family ferric uptake transcriptional regulator